ncbi:hypothetical protein BC629DRAFT_1503956 [Irpex lacteus]|nr:hypothetical protein BC629DRAFT_1503956 [Irpex lacteus]
MVGLGMVSGEEMKWYRAAEYEEYVEGTFVLLEDMSLELCGFRSDGGLPLLEYRPTPIDWYPFALVALTTLPSSYRLGPLVFPSKQSLILVLSGIPFSFVYPLGHPDHLSQLIDSRFQKPYDLRRRCSRLWQSIVKMPVLRFLNSTCIDSLRHQICPCDHLSITSPIAPRTHSSTPGPLPSKIHRKRLIVVYPASGLATMEGPFDILRFKQPTLANCMLLAWLGELSSFGR